MALIKCRECGNDVSTEAATCPKCGAPTLEGQERQRQFQAHIQKEKEKAGGGGCLIIFVLIVIVALGTLGKLLVGL